MKASAPLLATILITGLVQSASAATLSVQRATGRPGSLVDLEVRIDDAADLGGFDVVLAFDPEAAQAVGALPGPALADSLFRWSELEPGRVLVTAGDVPALPDGEAVFAVTFQLYAPEVEAHPVTVDMARAYRRGAPEPLELTTRDGVLVFRTGLPRWVWALAGLGLALLAAILLHLARRHRIGVQES